MENPHPLRIYTSSLTSPGIGIGWPVGSGGQPPSAATPSPHTPSQPPAQQPINFPNETLGLPNGFPRNPWGTWGAIIPSANCGDLGPCPTIGNGFQAAAATIGGTIICEIAEPCGAIEDILLVGGLIVEGGAIIYQMGKRQSNEWSDEAKRVAPNNPCGWLAEQLTLATDSATKGKIVQAQKYLKCRNQSKRNQ